MQMDDDAHVCNVIHSFLWNAANRRCRRALGWNNDGNERSREQRVEHGQNVGMNKSDERPIGARDNIELVRPRAGRLIAWATVSRGGEDGLRDRAEEVGRLIKLSGRLG